MYKIQQTENFSLIISNRLHDTSSKLNIVNFLKPLLPGPMFNPLRCSLSFRPPIAFNF